MPQTLLIVEDEPSLVPVLTQALRESGYRVSSATTGREGAEALRNGNFSAAVLDLMLPGLSGFDVISLVREQGVSTPILVLSARGGVDDKIRALDLGADDYLPKPFKTEELLARIRALLRRAAPVSNQISFADLTIELDTRSVQRAGKPIILSQKEYAMLELLMKNQGRPLSKSALLAQVWKGKSFETDNVVEVYIGYLRQKTEEVGLPRLIQTVRGYGYVLNESGGA